MNADVVVLRCRQGVGGRLEVLSPGVGWWSDHPHAGAVVDSGAPVGQLSTLNRRFDLVLPDGVAGRAVGEMSRRRLVAVEYGEVLFEVVPVGADVEIVAGDDGMHGADLPEGSRAIAAPTDGFFYRCPSPGAPAFVEVGSRVRTGQPLGLVEVMKTFNQILYGGPGFPEEGEIVAIRAEDGDEIRAGQVLMVVR